MDKCPTIIGENQPEPFKYRTTLLHTLSAVCDIINDSDKLNKNLSAISLELILCFLLCINLDMETRCDTHMTSTLRGGGEGWESKAKMRCYQTLEVGELASVLDAQSL